MLLDASPADAPIEPAPAGRPSPPAADPRSERRYAHGELLLAAFIAARRPLTFEDLASVLVDTGARVSDLLNWMASSQSNGLITASGYALGDAGCPVGPRLFSLSEEARAELRARRSRRRARIAA